MRRCIGRHCLVNKIEGFRLPGGVALGIAGQYFILAFANTGKLDSTFCPDCLACTAAEVFKATGYTRGIIIFGQYTIPTGTRSAAYATAYGPIYAGPIAAGPSSLAKPVTPQPLPRCMPITPIPF